jgi:hypothetical protein
VDKATKQPLPGANVQLLGTNAGAATDLDGHFKIANIEENIYKLQITYIGYLPLIETNVRVIRDKVTYVQAIELTSAPIETEKVILTVRTADEDETQPVSSFTATRDEIVRAPGAAGDIFRALEAMPGVSTSGGEFSAFSVRGGSPRENIILVDNIPYQKLSHFDGGVNEDEEAQGGRFSVFAPGVIEEATFRAGGFSAQYGGKFSSMLDLKIREGNRENFTVDGRLDMLGWEINYDGPSYLHEKTSLFVSARHHDFNRILELTGQEETGSPQFTDIIAKITTELNQKNKLSLITLYMPETFDRTSEHVYESDDFAETEVGDFDEKKWLTGLNLRTLTSKKSYWQNTIYYGHLDRDLSFGNAFARDEIAGPQSPDDFTSRIKFRESVVDKELGARSSFNYFPSDAFSLSAGFEAKRKDYDFDREQFGLDTLFVYDRDDFRPDTSQKFIVVPPEYVTERFNDVRHFMATFGEASFSPIKNITLTAGLRHEYNEFGRQHNFSPRGSLSWRINPLTRLSFASGVYYQSPRFEIFTADSRNQSLQDERSVHMIAAFSRYLRNDLRFLSEVYYKRFDQLIVRPDRTDLVYTNDGDGWAAGIDVAVIKNFVDKFYGQVNYSYSQSKRDDNNDEGSYNSDFHQPHIFSILAGYEFNKEWSMSAKWRYATGRPTDSSSINEDIFSDPTMLRYSKEIVDNNGRRLPDFHTLNVRVDYRKQFGRLALVSFLDIVNVYNHLNANQELFLFLTGEHSDKGFGILPTFGLKLEF